MFQKLGEKFRRFMYGRYGSDQLNVFLLILGVALCLLGSFSRLYYLGLIAYVPLIFGVLLFVAFFVCAQKVPEKLLRRSVPYGAYGQPYYAQQGQYVAGQPVQQPYYGAPVPPQQAAPQPAPQPSVADGVEEKVKLLTQYKQLLDSGILTQEEFDKLKAETLGTN